MMVDRGALFVISAPSGAGKTSLVNALVKILPQVRCSISHTTRPKRPQEQEGIDYHFINEAQFKILIEEKAFLEHANVFGNFYGTSRDWVEKTCAQGIDVILEIDWQGAQQIREQFPQVQSIYILPLSQSVLLTRLQKRHPEDPNNLIETRMRDARAQMSHYQEYDYLVFNDNFEDALADLTSIIRCHRLARTRQQIARASILSQLTS